MTTSLEPEQEDVLVRMVEAQRSLPRQERMAFFLMETWQKTMLVHRGDRSIEVYRGDLDALAMKGFIYIAGYGGLGAPQYDISLDGYAYYEEINTKRREPAEQVETEVVRYLDANAFQVAHSKALAKWNEAARRLWAPTWEQDLTNIGHLCREAIQEFADDLVKSFNPPDASTERGKDINRIAAVLSQQGAKVGEREAEFLASLLNYWKTVSGLVQRQEHGTQKERPALNWEDARRVVFQTAVVMFELDRALR